MFVTHLMLSEAQTDPFLQHDRVENNQLLLITMQHIFKYRVSGWEMLELSRLLTVLTNSLTWAAYLVSLTSVSWYVNRGLTQSESALRTNEITWVTVRSSVRDLGTDTFPSNVCLQISLCS